MIDALVSALARPAARGFRRRGARRGARRSPPRSAAPSAPAPSRAAEAPVSRDMDAALSTRLAYVVTGDAAVDETSRQGLDRA